MMRRNLSNMEQSLNQISNEIPKLQNEPLWISKIDLQYAYGQLKLFEETSKQCNFAITGGNMKEIIDIKKILRFIRHSNNKPRNIELTLSYQTPVR